MMVRERTARIVRTLLIAAPLLVGLSATADAQIRFGVELPSIRIGVNFDRYPDLVVIPGYPVYYDPQSEANYFFYDGSYWIFRNDTWYSSGWYNGPWRSVDPEAVPLYLLRVPVRYYRQPPPYFHGWGEDAPPRWGQHWGHRWEQRHAGWDQWKRGSGPRAAPLPVYQRQYSGGRYPDSLARQRAIQSQSAPTPQRQPMRQRTTQAQPAYRAPSHAPQGRPSGNGHAQHAPQGRPSGNGHAQHAPQGRPSGNGHAQHAPQGRPSGNGHAQHAPQGRPSDKGHAQHAPPQSMGHSN